MQCTKTFRTAVTTALWLCICGVASGQSAPTALGGTENGIVFHCEAPRLAALQNAVDGYLLELGIDAAWVDKALDADRGTLSYVATAAVAAQGTLELIDQPRWGIVEELVSLPAGKRADRIVLTVSKKEIVLAMLQPGRSTVFGVRACDAQALRDHVAIRQNIVAWTESLQWQWPDGGPARWNNTYWRRGTPHKNVPLHVAVNDAFINQKRYSIGCYTATKLVMIQGILDYFRRIKKDPATLKLVEAQLQRGGEPLSFIEPGAMWRFEADVTQADLARPGKVLGIARGIAANHFIPGDWSYFLNTDPVTYEKTGYEGSNALYLGRGKFDDFYEDHHHYYTYKEKLNEVYQWRNKVFSASRDVARVKPLNAKDFERITATPEAGGIVLDLRVFPLQFGYQDLPDHAFLP
jgi:hypothetical protein